MNTPAQAGSRHRGQTPSLGDGSILLARRAQIELVTTQLSTHESRHFPGRRGVRPPARPRTVGAVLALQAPRVTVTGTEPLALLVPADAAAKRRLEFGDPGL
jgi:hypothetical protein